MGYFAQTISAIETTPPLSQWTSWMFPPDVVVTQIAHLNMPSLLYLDLGGNPVSTLPWSELANLISLYATGTRVQQLLLNTCPNLRSVSVSSNDSATMLVAGGLSSLEYLDASNCPNLSIVQLNGCPNLNNVWLSSCNLSTALVNDVLAHLLANSVSDGICDLTGNAAPTGAGIAARNSLVDMGWTILTA